MVDIGPGGFPENGVVFENSLQETGLLPAAGVDLLLHQDPAEQRPEPLRVGQDGVQPGEQPEREDLVGHHVAVDHHHLQGLRGWNTFIQLRVSYNF